MTYNVSSGTLNLTILLYIRILRPQLVSLGTKRCWDPSPDALS